MTRPEGRPAWHTYNPTMAEAKSRASFLIIGRTREGMNFRPSDWAERLSGIMAPFHESYAAPSLQVAGEGPIQTSAGRQPPPSGLGALQPSGLLYSPFVVPVLVRPPGDPHGPSVRAVKVHGRLHQIEPMAYAFLRQFAADNDLLTREEPDAPG